MTRQRVRRSWLASLFPLFAILSMVSAGGLPYAAAVPSTCAPGWAVVAEVDNSFRWENSSGGLASWDGVFQLLENRDSSCYVYEIRLVFTGPLGGGIVNLSGYDIGMSFSIQYPTPYALWVDVPINAYGNANSWRPGGWQGHRDNFGLFYAHIHEDINARGAEEYYIGTHHPLDLFWNPFHGTAHSVMVPGVEVVFALPLSLLGQTVHVQMHAWPDRANSVTPLFIPGAAPPSLP